MGGFNINTEAQKNLLRYAAGKENLEKLAQKLDAAGGSDTQVRADEDALMSEPMQNDE